MYMVKITQRLLDVLFPPRDSELTIRKLTQTEFNRAYAASTTEGVRHLFRYQEPCIAALIQEAKFHNSKVAQKLLATELHKRYLTCLEKCRIVPIPLGPARQKERGHNQVLSILRALPKESHHIIDTKLLRRTVETPPQVSLSRRERLSNVENVFTCNSGKCIDAVKEPVILIDDVTTTGATLQAARRTLQSHLPPNTVIHCVALAH